MRCAALPESGLALPGLRKPTSSCTGTNCKQAAPSSSASRPSSILLHPHPPLNRCPTGPGVAAQPSSILLHPHPPLNRCPTGPGVAAQPGWLCQNDHCGVREPAHLPQDGQEQVQVRMCTAQSETSAGACALARTCMWPAPPLPRPPSQEEATMTTLLRCTHTHTYTHTHACGQPPLALPLPHNEGNHDLPADCRACVCERVHMPVCVHMRVCVPVCALEAWVVGGIWGAKVAVLASIGTHPQRSQVHRPHQREAAGRPHLLHHPPLGLQLCQPAGDHPGVCEAGGCALCSLPTCPHLAAECGLPTLCPHAPCPGRAEPARVRCVWRHPGHTSPWTLDALRVHLRDGEAYPPLGPRRALCLAHRAHIRAVHMGSPQHPHPCPCARTCSCPPTWTTSLCGLTSCA